MSQIHNSTFVANQIRTAQSPAELIMNSDKLSEFYIEEDQQFLNQIQQIYEKKASTMKSFFDESQISHQQCDQIAQFAEIHSKANIFNSNSILSYNQFKKDSRIEYCSCGCKKAVGKELSLFLNEQKLTILGPGVLLFFFFLKNVKIIVVFLAIVFGIYATVSNILSPSYVNFDNCFEKTNQFQFAICHLNQISTFNLKKSQFLKQVQLWIGAFAAIFWFFGIKFIEFIGNKKNQQIDDLLDSASDYTIRIENLPFGETTQQQIIQYLQQLWKQSTSENSNQQIIFDNFAQIQPYKLNLRSIQIIYNMQECRALINKIHNISIQILGLIQEQKLISLQNIAIYNEKKKQFHESFKNIESLRRNFINNPQFRKSLSTTCALVYFHESDMQTNFIKRFAHKSPLNPFQALCQNKKKYIFKGNQITFTRAPQPSDFFWPNCEIKFSYIRYFIIWAITMVILYSAYALVSYIQTIKEVKSSALILISVIIQCFNRIIWFSLSFLVTFQYHNTKTDEIVSLMKKSIFAQIINVVVAPMIGKFLNNKPLYGEVSISINAMSYQFVMFFMMVIFYVINPFYYMKLIIRNIKCLRNKMIKKYCQVIGEIDTMSQIQPVLLYYEGPPFPIAGAYVYMVTAVIHSMFYCHLQPIILIVLIANMTGFYYIMKYLLFRRCKIPELTDIQIFEIATFALSYGTFFYGVGSILFTLLQKFDNDVLSSVTALELLPSSLCLTIWMFLSFNPWQITTKILESIFQLFSFKKQFIQFQESKTLNNKKVNDIFSQIITTALEQLKNNDPLICERKQSYYKHSNAHKLFNYQSEIKEITNQQAIKRTHELQKFCEGFCKKSAIKLQSCSEKSEEQRMMKMQEELAEMILIPAFQMKKGTIKENQQCRRTVKPGTLKSREKSKTNLILNKLFSKFAENNKNKQNESMTSEKENKNVFEAQDPKLQSIEFEDLNFKKNEQQFGK